MSSFITTSKSTVSITKIYNELKYNSQNLFKKSQQRSGLRFPYLKLQIYSFSNKDKAKRKFNWLNRCWNGMLTFKTTHFIISACLRGITLSESFFFLLEYNSHNEQAEIKFDWCIWIHSRLVVWYWTFHKTP